MTVAALRLFWHYLHGPRWWLACLLTVASGVGFAMLYRTWTTTAEDREFAAKGVRTEAQIMLRSESPEWEGPEDRPEMKSRYRLHYHFKDADDEEQVGVALVPKATWLRYQLGDYLTIEYLSEQPARSRALERERPALGVAGMLVFGVGLLGILSGFVLMAGAWVRAWRRWRVVRKGIPCLGRVTEFLAPGTRNGQDSMAANAPAVHLGYTFKDQRGMLHDGRTAPLAPRLASRWHPGDPILVLYAPNDMFRHEVDLFGTRAHDLNMLLQRVAD
jgi:hypothetical protein